MVEAHAEANIELPTGTPTGVLVVDVDIHTGASGFAAFEMARTEGFDDTWAWLVRTPSGGLHAYYPNVRGEEQRSWQVPGAHIDFRGDGGYIIAPPSRVAVDGAMRSYVVIAVATHAAKPVDAVGLRRFLEPPRPALISLSVFDYRWPRATRAAVVGAQRVPPTEPVRHFRAMPRAELEAAGGRSRAGADATAIPDMSRFYVVTACAAASTSSSHPTRLPNRRTASGETQR